MKTSTLAMISLCTMALAAGCSSARDVEITGEVSSAQSVAGPITLSFYEVADEGGEAAERLLVSTSEIAELGAFSETVEVAEDTVVVVALADADGDGSCTDGELWAEAEAQVNDDDTVEPLALDLAASPCPPAE